jgi:hypothetical protein
LVFTLARAIAARTSFYLATVRYHCGNVGCHLLGKYEPIAHDGCSESERQGNLFLKAADDKVAMYGR